MLLVCWIGGLPNNSHKSRYSFIWIQCRVYACAILCSYVYLYHFRPRHRQGNSTAATAYREENMEMTWHASVFYKQDRQ